MQNTDTSPETPNTETVTDTATPIAASAAAKAFHTMRDSLKGGTRREIRKARREVRRVWREARRTVRKAARAARREIRISRRADLRDAVARLTGKPTTATAG